MYQLLFIYACNYNFAKTTIIMVTEYADITYRDIVALILIIGRKHYTLILSLLSP